ncbi:MAG TPA: transporter substrate-binding domain-containing protein [Sneathiellales bacterium]|nr:transporter substrate-binding domain-containing protein [Sneathiellales bacterium]
MPITRIKDLHGRNLALPRGSYVGFPIATDPEIRRFSTNGYAQSARLLKAGRVDAIAGTALSIYYHLSVMKMGRTDIGGILSFASKPVWLHCAKRQLSEKLVVRMRQATNSLRKEGAFRRMLDRYVPVGFR